MLIPTTIMLPYIPDRLVVACESLWQLKLVHGCRQSFNSSTRAIRMRTDGATEQGSCQHLNEHK